MNSQPAARTRAILIDAVTLAVLCGSAGLAFGPAYGGLRYLVALGVGAILGSTVAAVCAILRWPIFIAVIGVGIGYYLCGAAVATPDTAFLGWFPTLESIRELSLGLILGWKQLLTVGVPVGQSGALLVPAFATALLGTAVAVLLATRVRRRYLALVGPVCIAVVAALLGTVRPQAPLVGGLLLGLGGLIWASAGIRLNWRRPVSLLLVLVGASGSAYAVTLLPQLAVPRTALREIISAPFNPQDYPSPLNTFRRYVRADAKKDMFVVSGLPAGGKLRLATFDKYDGRGFVMGEAAADFRRIGTSLASGSAGEQVTITITVKGYQNVWVPIAGELSAIQFTGLRGADQAATLLRASETGTVAVPAGLVDGDIIRQTVAIRQQPQAEDLAEAAIGPGAVNPARIPDPLKAAAVSYSDGQTSVYRKVEAVRKQLSARGSLSHGDKAPSASGHGFDRMMRLMTDKHMVGDQEQFAPALALMVSQLGIPARVVVGFAPPKNYSGHGELVLKGADLTAWVEVSFAGFGWVAFDPTPDISQVQQQTEPKPSAAPKKQPLQPPPPPRAEQDTDAKNVVQVNQQDQKKGDDAPAGNTSRTTVVLLWAIGMPILLFLAPIGLILGVKYRRRRRRRRASGARRQVAGAWETVVERAVDYGLQLPACLTRMEAAGRIDQAFGTTTAILARQANAGTFAPEDVASNQAVGYWLRAHAMVKSLDRQRPWFARLRARLSTASLRRKGGVG